mmetsp:Transcript_52527/g.94227  ORF Transcript_52527/g.94227 Transcript_52527/m.94227 type:complete len:207 (+) Transcript_52527:495-1115(+)
MDLYASDSCSCWASSLKISTSFSSSSVWASISFAATSASCAAFFPSSFHSLPISSTSAVSSSWMAGSKPIGSWIPFDLASAALPSRASTSLCRSAIWPSKFAICLCSSERSCSSESYSALTTARRDLLVSALPRRRSAFTATSATGKPSPFWSSFLACSSTASEKREELSKTLQSQFTTVRKFTTRKSTPRMQLIRAVRTLAHAPQ